MLHSKFKLMTAENGKVELISTVMPIYDKRLTENFVKTKFCELFGGIAQLVEHLPCKQGVSGSIPLTSTKRPDCGRKMQ